MTDLIGRAKLTDFGNWLFMAHRKQCAVQALPRDRQPAFSRSHDFA
jgi:hypothetical protein